MARQRRRSRDTLSESRAAPLEQDESRRPDSSAEISPPATLYTCPQYPGRWIGTDEHGTLVHWPSSVGGWTARTPYLGHRRALTAVDAAEARGTGWPGGGAGRRRLTGSETGRPLTIRLDNTRRSALGALARKQGQTPSDTVREAIDLAIARGSTR